MKRRGVLIPIVSLLAVAVVGCGSNQAAPAASPPAQPAAQSSQAPAPAKPPAEKITIKFAMVNAASHPAPTAMKEVFKPMVEKETGGRVEVQLFTDAQLGGEKDELEQVRLGTIQMTYISPLIASVEPKVNIFDLPFLFKDYAHVDKVIDGPLGQEVVKDLPQKAGIRSLAIMENGFRKISNSKRAINGLEDIKGLKLRVPEAPMSIAIMKALGANTVAMAFPEVYGALQQGVIDGQENAYEVWTSSKLYEVQKFGAETNHMWGAFFILTNEKWFSGLPKDIQDAVSKAAQAAAKEERRLLREKEANNEKLLREKGLTMTKPPFDPLFKAVQPVYADFHMKYPNYKDLVEKIIAAGK